MRWLKALMALPAAIEGVVELARALRRLSETLSDDEPNGESIRNAARRARDSAADVEERTLLEKASPKRKRRRARGSGP